MDAAGGTGGVAPLARLLMAEPATLKVLECVGMRTDGRDPVKVERLRAIAGISTGQLYYHLSVLVHRGLVTMTPPAPVGAPSSGLGCEVTDLGRRAIWDVPRLMPSNALTVPDPGGEFVAVSG